MKKVSVFLVMGFMASSGYAMKVEKGDCSLPVGTVESSVAIKVIYDFMQCWKELQESMPQSKPNLFALHQACNVGNFDQVCKRIRAGSSVHDKDEDGDAPIHKAVKRGFIKIVRYLLENGAEIDVKDKNGKTPIDIINENAAYKKQTLKFDTSKDFDTGFTEMVHLLVKKGAKVSVQTEQKRTILNTLINLPMETDTKKQMRNNCVKLLLISGAKIFDEKRNELVSFNSDFVMGQPEIIQLLLSHI